MSFYDTRNRTHSPVWRRGEGVPICDVSYHSCSFPVDYVKSEKKIGTTQPREGTQRTRARA